MKLGWVKNHEIIANFNGGHITSDGGILLLKKINKKLKLTEKISKIIKDNRMKNKCKHSISSIIKQRIFGIACGHEDLNDHNQLRRDILFQTAVGSDKKLASSSTLSRIESNFGESSVYKINEILIEIFINFYKKQPKEIILDFDATDDKVHGKQTGSKYNGYYRHKCFLPLYVFCNDHLLFAYLRPGNVPGNKDSFNILKFIIKKIRLVWKKTKIIFRGDSAFSNHEMFDWCENNAVKYITGISGNSRLVKYAKPFINESKKLFNKHGKKQKIFGEFKYSAKSWNKERRIIIKSEYNIYGKNTRFIVTNLNGNPEYLYKKVYCARGEMENRIKEQQLHLFADRTSSKFWRSNQFRLLLSGLAYTLLNAIRLICLKGTEISNATCSTIRIKLLKIGAIIKRKTRTVKILLSNAYPYKNLFKLAVMRL